MKYIILAVFVFIIAAMSFNVVSIYNLGNRMEKNIQATYENNQNILAQYSQKIAEAAQVPSMQRDDLKDVVKTALESRYGDTGSKALFQFLQEQNPQINSEVYIKLQQIIEAGRDDFEIAQTKLIDQKRVYQTELGTAWGGTILGALGYPKIDLDSYKIITTQSVNDTFETGIETPIKLR